ncbi:hypothetical protein M7I_7339 [Glarea lozoyensis 74030]|uniref:Uncharacterized protein n=1 Tax=Glarea lozoyensis (strain ATCC 74030 / MF5533) TaxID=1104152 RepID=H0EX14_GLAL7|nr:hypothetical protein M7I_7339 [Glarea lozoyensis 74030]
MGGASKSTEALAFRLRRKKNMRPKSAITATPAIPTPIPALAPVERVLDGVDGGKAAEEDVLWGVVVGSARAIPVVDADTAVIVDIELEEVELVIAPRVQALKKIVRGVPKN